MLRAFLRGGFLDSLYYDVGALSYWERTHAYVAREGTIIVVRPGRQHNVQLFRNVDDLLAEHSGDDSIRAIAVAGVGSSSIGTAAFAKNVANALDMPVAGIVSGYGMLDLLPESISGWVFPLGDRGVEEWTKAWNLSDEVFWPREHRTSEPESEEESKKREADTATLSELLARNGDKVEWVLGHSKGAVTVAKALRALESHRVEKEERLGTDLRVVTFGCGVELPEPLRRIRQYLGSLDSLGVLNTIGSRGMVKLDATGHSTNPAMPWSINVEELLGELLASNF